MWIVVFFLVGIWFGMCYRWLEVQNLTIQLFIQCNEFEIERQLWEQELENKVEQWRELNQWQDQDTCKKEHLRSWHSMLDNKEKS